MPENESYEVVIGLEVHAQLLTRTKLFCSDTTLFGKEPNSQVSVISLGHPGTLPRLNREAIQLAVRLGLATNCSIVQHNYFARKNYSYPDLPKGYQITQHTTPICRNGHLDVTAEGKSSRIRINRIHMEEDAGKSVHDAGPGYSGIDYNRAGMPLLEIVTEPDIRSGAEAAAYVTALRQLVRHLGVCDGNMEEGSLRCDVNISVRLKGDKELGTKVEIKNLNSIRFIRRAIESESERLMGMHRRGEKILQQTHGLQEQDFSTYPIRTKEDEDDYRYFPEPDLPPFYVSDELIQSIRSSMPPLPEAIRGELETTYGLSRYDAEQISSNLESTHYFKELSQLTTHHKTAANWVIGPLKNLFEEDAEQKLKATIPPASVSRLIDLIEAGTLTHAIAVQQVLPQLIADPETDVEMYIDQQGLKVQNDSGELEGMVAAALERHADKIPAYKKGKKGLLSVFVGEVMKQSKGKADARLITDIIIQKLNN
jgi:aspartyl-tRNA(Asn)/glutamyl-tRNA(Gln) amidotransferase subunit B